MKTNSTNAIVRKNTILMEIYKVRKKMILKKGPDGGRSHGEENRQHQQIHPSFLFAYLLHDHHL